LLARKFADVSWRTQQGQKAGALFDLTGSYTRLSDIDLPPLPFEFPIFLDNYAFRGSVSVPLSDYVFSLVARQLGQVVAVTNDVAFRRLDARIAGFLLAGGKGSEGKVRATHQDVAMEVGTEVINLSLAGPFDPLLSRLLDEAIRRGTVVVAAHPEGDVAFPASHPRVIVAHSPAGPVGATSGYALAAPAEEILTTAPDSGYVFLSGSSLAAAHVTGVIALMMERDPSIDVESFASLLAQTAETTINACRVLEALIETSVCDLEIASF